MTALFGYVTALLEYFDLVLSNICQVKFSHDPLTNGYSLGAPLGFHRLHRNMYLIVGVTLFLHEKMMKSCLGDFKENFQGIK